MKQIALDKLVLENNPAGLPRCGLYLNRAGPDYSLPLSLLDVEVYIHHSLVDVQQRLVYQNPCSDYIDAVYCFPIDPSAALHRFEVAMDGQVVRGLVKEKEAARKEFAEKKAEGATVALAEVLPESKDVLTIKVGNLPPGK
jgi:Ca-activated chloride channel homolog